MRHDRLKNQLGEMILKIEIEFSLKHEVYGGSRVSLKRKRKEKEKEKEK
jgi:hypothetical protein